VARRTSTTMTRALTASLFDASVVVSIGRDRL
jgi:hypothetical protein